MATISLYGYNFSADGLQYGKDVIVFDKSVDFDLTSDSDNDRYYDDLPYHERGWKRTGDKVKGRYTLVNTGLDGALSTDGGATTISYTITDPTNFFVYPVVDVFRDLWHLEGEEVAVLLDGNVIARKTVTNGSVDVSGDNGGGVAQIGLRYITDIETLDIENPNSVLQRKQKIVHRLSLKVEKTRGGRYGDNSDHLVDFPQRVDEAYAEPTHLRTGKFAIPLDPYWNSKGRVFIRQEDPLPITILSISTDMEIEDV